MDPTINSPKQIQSTTLPQKFKKIQQSNKNGAEKITRTPLRLRHNQMLASIQSGTPQFKLLRRQQDIKKYNRESFPLQQHPYQTKQSQKENVVLTCHRKSNNAKQSHFLFRNKDQNAQKNESLTPKHALHTDSLSKIETEQQITRKCHRKKLSTDLDVAYDVQKNLSFKMLLDNRCKTTTNKRQIQGWSQSEHVEKQFLKRFKDRTSKEPENYLIKQQQAKETKISKSNHIKCSNKDGRNARYQIITKDSPSSDNLYFCSRCTIPLVQQGFILQEIKQVQPQPRPPSSSLNGNLRANMIQKIRQKRKMTVKMLDNLKQHQNQDVNEVSAFYGDLIDILLRLQDEDKQTIKAYYFNVEREIDRKVKQIDEIIHLIDSKKVDASSELIQSLITEQQSQWRKDIVFKRDAKNSFIHNFHGEIRPDLYKYQLKQTSSVGKYLNMNQLAYKSFTSSLRYQQQ